MLPQIKVLTIQDISCTGRCSITVALPILSACGFNTSVVPTSVLSTHTGGFDGYYHRDLTGDMDEILNHWKTLGLRFDAIYVGFLANADQVENTIRFINELKDKNTFVFIDPAMADDGELYSLLAPEFPIAMKKLIKSGDLICPNMTEAYMLLGETYTPGPYSSEEIEVMAKMLGEIADADVVITGIDTLDGGIGAASFDHRSEAFHMYTSKKIEGFFYGTGDVFMSTLISGMLNAMSMEYAVDVACEFVVDCVERTASMESDYRYGVDFERGIPLMLRLLGIIDQD